MAQAALDERHGEAAVGQVVGGREQPTSSGLLQQRGERLLGGEVDDRRTAAEVVVDDVGPGGAAQLLARLAEQEHVLAVAGNPCVTRARTSSMTPSTPTTGVGRIAMSPVWL